MQHLPTNSVVQSPAMGSDACLFRPMTEADIPQVYAIDHECFPAESMFRPYSSYGREMHNSMAHYIVACVPSRQRSEHMRRSWMRRLLSGGSLSTSPATTRQDLLVGFAGFWVMLDEAHIIAIAVRKPYRRQAIGEGLLLCVIDMATSLRTRLLTLEVRASNHPAQQMYLKHGFHVVGKRPRYYSDNQEDAVLMSIEDLQDPEFRERFRQQKSELLQQDYLSRAIEIPEDSFDPVPD